MSNLINYHDLFGAFKEWATRAGYDMAYTHNGLQWICLNPMTADLWEAYKAGHFTCLEPKKGQQ